MGYEEGWKVLESLIGELRKHDISVSPEIINDLRSAKTMIRVFKADPSRAEYIPTIESYLESVESRLMGLSLEKFGNTFVEEWMKKLDEAKKEVEEKKAEYKDSNFVPRVRGSEYWVRVQLSKEISEEDVKKIVDEISLSCKIQENHYVLVYGSKEKVKDFVKKMRPPEKLVKS